MLLPSNTPPLNAYFPIFSDEELDTLGHEEDAVIVIVGASGVALTFPLKPNPSWL
jgi:hypothetical protein